MKRRDEGRASLVDFLRSIKYARVKRSRHEGEFTDHFAGFNPHARSGKRRCADDSEPVRSAN